MKPEVIFVYDKWGNLSEMKGMCKKKDLKKQFQDLEENNKLEV